MRTTFSIQMVFLLVLGCLTACGGGDHSQEHGDAVHEAPAEAPADAGGVVTVAADGTQFDPPVELDRIPDGAWICNMGTVHYASLEQGEGTCPICSMELEQHGAEAHGEHDGHEH